MALVVKNPPANARDIRDVGSIPELGRSPRGGYGNSLQYPWPGESHGQRSLMGYSVQVHKEPDLTKETECALQDRVLVLFYCLH